MQLFFFLRRGSWKIVTLATAIALLGGACNAGLLALINTALHHAETASAVLVWSFVGLGLVRVTAAAYSQYLLSAYAQRTMAGLRRDLCSKILAAPLRHLETVGSPRLLVALTEDVITITMALRYIPSVAVDIAMLVGCFIYLAWLSWTVFLVLLVVTILGLLCYWGLFAKAFRSLRLARDEQDTLFRHFRALTEGIKELRLHRKRRETFFTQHIQPTTEAFERHNITASIHFIIAYGWTQLLFIILIGMVLLAMPALRAVHTEVLTGYILTILYLMGPMRQLMNNLPGFGRANIALQKIEQLGLSLATQSPDNGVVALSEPLLIFNHLELKDISFAYHNEGEDGHFILGPLSFTLRKGDLVFVVGGNGSGKSTLVRLLTGLYSPESGEIRLDGQCITEQNRDWYRQHFSATFSDFYLFESLLGLTAPDLDRRAKDYLVQLQLDHKVQIQDGVLSTTALSQGQRKRLALLTAYLEDRPIYIFDEWAADQDPQFKQLFYTKLLPELKSRGKAVLVISHDDRYFHLADRILKLDYGKPVGPSNSLTAPFTANTHPQHI